MGLQGMSRGQYEAAESIGIELLPDHAVWLSLPQALKIVIPPTVSHPHFRLQRHVAGGHHRPVRFAQDHADGPFQSGMDGVQ